MARRLVQVCTYRFVTCTRIRSIRQQHSSCLSCSFAFQQRVCCFFESYCVDDAFLSPFHFRSAGQWHESCFSVSATRARVLYLHGCSNMSLLLLDWITIFFSCLFCSPFQLEIRAAVTLAQCPLLSVCSTDEQQMCSQFCVILTWNH